MSWLLPFGSFSKGDSDMKRVSIAALPSVVVAALFALATLHAQQHPADHQRDTAKPAAPAAAQTDAVAEIFCPTMKTGQLCSHGTTEALQLSGAKADQWLAAVRKYNRAVDLATKQLQADAKTVLTPQQVAEVQRWFALGLNPE